ncbi:MAG: biotin--[acetyl-CoA-carboxylase] ligase [Synergistes sp.]|nr:biotin--[acetyl-CoA-carboxylase] ligase [Synergistes sp.]
MALYDIDAKRIESQLSNNRYFQRFIYLDETYSTQVYLKNLAKETFGAIALAETQSNGRGRQGRSWQSVKGKNLTFSILLHPNIKPTEAQLISLTAGMAMKKTLTEICRTEFHLKWPNDILCGGKKICGIITEAASTADRILYAVTGIGLNVNMERSEIPKELSDIATSLAIEAGKKYSREDVLLKFICNFSEYIALFNSCDTAAIIDSYRKQCDTIGRTVRVICDDKTLYGRACGITDEGAIIIKTDQGTMTFAAADIVHLRMHDTAE